jgi:hypothetical protein
LNYHRLPPSPHAAHNAELLLLHSAAHKSVCGAITAEVRSAPLEVCVRRPGVRRTTFMGPVSANRHIFGPRVTIDLSPLCAPKRTRDYLCDQIQSEHTAALGRDTGASSRA